jgi:hypothetical protein
MYLKAGERKMNQLQNYKTVAKKVKKIFEKHGGKVDVYVFGSLVEGKPTALSDIDILIVADNISQQEIYKLKVQAYKATTAPIELHVASTKEFENWYKRFISKLEKIA